MEKPKFKLLKEFKDFISKGSVLDLAVGMIIGAAFTAIITAVVTNILQPLINLIPVSDTGLITVLRDPVYAEDGVTVLTEALVINWGAVISAVITFLLTSLVLFVIVKAINTAKKGAEKLKETVEQQFEDETAEEQPTEEAAPQEEAAPEEEPLPELENASVELLKEIRDLLKAQAAKDQTPGDAE